jgi:hypothetical protein
VKKINLKEERFILAHKGGREGERERERREISLCLTWFSRTSCTGELFPNSSIHVPRAERARLPTCLTLRGFFRGYPKHTDVPVSIQDK